MAKILGDTSPSHASARFIAVDAAAITTALPAHAALIRRLARNSNILEAQTRRVLVHQQFLEDNDPDGATRLDTPLYASSPQVIVRNLACLGPWKLESSKPKIDCQFMYGLAAGGSFRYYWELRSEGLETVPPASAFTTLTNAGAAAWFADCTASKAVRAGETDWLALWIAPGDFGIADDIKVVNDQTGTIVAADNRGVQCTNAAAAASGFVAADFLPTYSKTLVVYDTATLPIPAGTPVFASFPIRGVIDAFNPGTFDSLDVQHHASSPMLLLVGKCFEIRSEMLVACRSVVVNEAEAASTADSQPRRLGAMFIDDKACNIGEQGMAALAYQIGTNADAVALRSPDTLVNQIHVEHDPDEHRYTAYLDDLAVWATAYEYGFVAEPGLDTLEASLVYTASGSIDGNFAVTCRMVLVDQFGTTVATSNEHDSEIALTMGGVPVAVPGAGVYETLGATRSVALGFWVRPWHYRALPNLLGPFSMDVSAYTGTPADALGVGVPVAVQFQIKGAVGGGGTVNAALRVLGAHVTCRAGVL